MGLQQHQNCHDRAPQGVGLRLLSTVSFLFVSPPRTFRNILLWPTYHCHDSYSRPFQYDVEWRSVFHELPGCSIWLHTLWTIYYKLYGIKYKYRVVAILYLQSCIRLLLDNPRIPLILYPVWALRSLLKPLPTVSLNPCFTATQSYSRRVVQSHQALDKNTWRRSMDGCIQNPFWSIPTNCHVFWPH